MNYDDIINLPHHISSKRDRMTMESRASQFAPFAALTGYDEAIKEVSRITSKKRELGENEINILNEKFQILNNNIKLFPMVKVIYFLHDSKKNGGKYVEVSDNLKKIDLIGRELSFKNNKNKVKLDDILNIESEIFFT